MSEEERFETIYRTSDPVMGEMLEDVLVTEGFDARLLGTRNAALLGAGQQIMQLKIEVPASQAAAAAQTLEAVLSEVEQDDEGEVLDALADEDGELENDPSVDRPKGASRDEYQPPRRVEGSGRKGRDPELRPPRSPKKRALAGGLPVVMPGLGQVYAGLPWAGLMLMLGIVTSFAAGTVVGDFTIFGVGYLIALVMDVVCGQLAVVAFNAGRKTSVSLQFAYGLAEVALAMGLVVLIVKLVE